MTTATDARTLLENRFADMVSGNLEAFRATMSPDATSREAIGPPAARVPGPDGFHAAALWLRGMFSDLGWEVHDAVGQGDVVVGHVTMRGRHTGPFTRYGPDGELILDVPATGREFAVRQTHWYRFRDGLVVEYWANRDDLGMLAQLEMVG